MATYQDIKGLRVKYLSSDPTLVAGGTGEVWYNSTSGTLKALVPFESFASGTNFPRINGGTSTNVGTATTGLVMGGTEAHGVATDAYNDVHEYNGTGFSVLATMPSDRIYYYAAGTSTAAFIAGGRGDSPGGDTTAATWNGTSWTAAPGAHPGAQWGGTAGTSTAAFLIGGEGGSPPNTGYLTQTFDGATFSSGTSTSDKHQGGNSACGIQTAALTLMGQGSPPGKVVEEWNGSSWTTNPAFPVQLNYTAGGAGGTVNDAIQIGGFTPPTGPWRANSYKWDGTTWTAGASMATGRYNGAGDGDASGMVMIGGQGSAGGGTNVNSTEEYQKSINTITAAAWASAPALNTARDEAASSQNGSQDAALYFGGYDGSNKNLTEEYDGSSWTAKNTLNTARYSGAGAGTTAAALYSGGYDGSITNATEEFDGTNWATQPNSMSTARINTGGCGLQTAALVYGGDEPALSDKTEAYNGTSWTAGGTLSTARSHVGGGIGTSTAAICVGGWIPAYTGATEAYNGSSWTAGGSLVSVQANMGGAGTATDGLVFGGTVAPGAPSYTGVTQGYDGTTWSTRPSLATARNYVSGTGTSSAGLAFGGGVPPYSTATEEFAGETSAATASTLTTS